MSVAPRQRSGSVDRECLMQAVELIRAGVVVTGPDSSVHYMNAAASAMIARGDGLVLRQGRLVAQRAADGARLRAAIAAGNPQLMLVSREGGRAYQLWLTAPCAGVLIVISDPESTFEEPETVLRALYELTPTEARLAARLMNGCSIGEAARGLGIASQTAKSHLKRIFLKTHTRRQSELVHQLMKSAATLRISVL